MENPREILSDTMRIASSDRRSFLEIHHLGDERYSSYRVRAEVETDWGRFSGENQDVQFFGWDQFLSEFDRFILERSLKPTLMGTYGCDLRFEALQSSQHVALLFTVQVEFQNQRPPAQICLTGQIEIEQDQLTELLREFRQLQQPTTERSSAVPVVALTPSIENLPRSSLDFPSQTGTIQLPASIRRMAPCL